MIAFADWLARAFGVAVLVWFVVALLHGYRADQRSRRCRHCRRLLFSPTDRRLHELDCRPAIGSSPARCPRPHRVGLPATTKSPHR